jgi:osmotically-inducible protein OsmY
MPTDTQLERDVLDELEADPKIIAAHIGVMVSAGIVVLTGHVDTLADKLAAETAVNRVKGVKGIAEGIEIRRSTIENQTDEQIAIGAINNLSWTSLVPRDAVKVKVETGWITLSGNVQSAAQKDAAEQIVHQLYGVTGVTNHISLESALVPPAGDFS